MPPPAPPLDHRRSVVGACLAAVFSPLGFGASADAANAASERFSTPGQASESITPRSATPWRSLMAPGWHPSSYFRSLSAVEIRDLDDDDPRAQVLLRELRAAGKKAPPAPGMNGKHVLLIGLCKPVSAPVENLIRQVLLMPYLDGCIHSPPPPGNQVVLIDSVPGLPQDVVPYRLWVEGTLEVKPTMTSEGFAAWRMRSPKYRLFDEAADRQWLVP